MSGQLPVRATAADVLLVVVRLEGKVDGIAGVVDGLKDDHEKRIRALEAARWPLRSIAALAGIAAVLAPIMVAWR